MSRIERPHSHDGHARDRAGALGLARARDNMRQAQLRLDAAWPTNPLDHKGWDELRAAMAAYREAADELNNAFFEEMRRDAREAAQRARDEEKAAEEKHEKELAQLVIVDEEFRRGREIVAKYEKQVELIESRTRSENTAKERELQEAYEEMLRSWKAHVEKLALDRVELIASEQASQSRKLTVWAMQDAAEMGRNDALAVYLQGLIAQATSSGDPVSIAMPASAPSADGSNSGSALVAALVAAAGSADDSGPLASKIKCAMPESEFFSMLDGLFAPKPAAPAKGPVTPKV